MATYRMTGGTHSRWETDDKGKAVLRTYKPGDTIEVPRAGGRIAMQAVPVLGDSSGSATVNQWAGLLSLSESVVVQTIRVMDSAESVQSIREAEEVSTTPRQNVLLACDEKINTFINTMLGE